MNDKLDGLLLNNRNRLKDLFLKLSPSRDGSISLQELTKFLKNVRIYPVYFTQDLISSPDLNKLLKRLNTASQISYTKFELIMKLIAEQSFNPLAPSLERIKMFIIHIRNYVKMHYQISLTINPVKKLLLETQEIFHTHQSASPTRQKNNSHKSLSRTSSICKPKVSEALQITVAEPLKKSSQRRESPGIVPHVHLLLSQKIGNMHSLNSTQSNEIISDRHKHLRSSSSAVAKPKNVEKLILDSFENFKSRHSTAVGKTGGNREGLVKKHDQYIGEVRKSLFSAGFVKAMIFNAWKGVVKNKCYFDVDN